MPEGSVALKGVYTFDYFIGMPILEGHAQRNLRHNYYREGVSEFGVQMCPKSGWLEFLKFSIDRVLKNHNLDGVYYDWNVALFCGNPSHTGKKTSDVSTGKTQQTVTNAPAGHWDMDELVELMEWTRQ